MYYIFQLFCKFDSLKCQIQPPGPEQICFVRYRGKSFQSFPSSIWEEGDTRRVSREWGRKPQAIAEVISLINITKLMKCVGLRSAHFSWKLIMVNATHYGCGQTKAICVAGGVWRPRKEWGINSHKSTGIIGWHLISDGPVESRSRNQSTARVEIGKVIWHLYYNSQIIFMK